jgi:hypothetical protein
MRANLPDYRFIVIADSRGKTHGINEEILRNIFEEIVDIYPLLKALSITVSKSTKTLIIIL